MRAFAVTLLLVAVGCGGAQKGERYPSMPRGDQTAKPATEVKAEPQAWLHCELENGVTGSALATPVQVRLLSEAGELIEEQKSNDGTCQFGVAPGAFSVVVAFPAYDIEYRFRRVLACVGKSTPVQMAIDLEKSQGDKETSDFDVPCEGF